MTPPAFAGMLEARLYVSRRLVTYSCGCAVLVALAAPCRRDLAALPLFVAGHRHCAGSDSRAPSASRPLRAKRAALWTRARARKGVGSLHRRHARDAALRRHAVRARFAHAAATLLLVPPAAIACALTALSATIRRGATRVLYVLLAFATSGGAYALAVVAHSFAGELAFCVVVAFLALRQYGETLARFDPI